VDAIASFIRRHGRVSDREVTVTFDLGDKEWASLEPEMLRQESLTVEGVGNGRFLRAELAKPKPPSRTARRRRSFGAGFALRSGSFMEELHVVPGDILASKYRVEKVLGVGGMGVVVAARHVALGNLVAIKLLQPRAYGVKGATERFLREGQAAAQLASPHVAKVLDVGQLDSGAPYMIMEHLAGSDLSSVIEKRGPIPLAEATEYILQACDAIGEAHAKGIVHRDLKPANLFLQVEPDGSPLVKVLDFGIAKVAGAEQNLTSTSQGMGSGGYMSPEQMSSAKKVDPRADIWALGVTLYQLVSAHLPFEADSMEQFVARVFFEQPTPVLEHRPELPAALNALLLRCLEKQPDARFPTVAHFAAALSPFAPPRAQIYVARIAKLLAVDLPEMDRISAAALPLPALPGTVAMAAAPPITSQPVLTAPPITSQPVLAAPPITSQPVLAAPPGPSGAPATSASPSSGTRPAGVPASTALSTGPISPMHQIPSPPGTSPRRSGLVVALAGVVTMAIVALIGWRVTASHGDDTTHLSAGSGSASVDAGEPPPVIASTTATATTTSPSAEPSGLSDAPPIVTADAGAPPAKSAHPPSPRPPAPAKTVAPTDPFGGKPISKSPRQ